MVFGVDFLGTKDMLEYLRTLKELKSNGATYYPVENLDAWFIHNTTEKHLVEYDMIKVEICFSINIQEKL